MRYWDTTIDRDIDMALDEMWKEEQARRAQEEAEYQALQSIHNISNPMALYGAI